MRYYNAMHTWSISVHRIIAWIIAVIIALLPFPHEYAFIEINAQVLPAEIGQSNIAHHYKKRRIKASNS